MPTYIIYVAELDRYYEQ